MHRWPCWPIWVVLLMVSVLPSVADPTMSAESIEPQMDAEMSPAAAASHPCDGLEGQDAVRCCARAAYDISMEAQQRALDVADTQLAAYHAAQDAADGTLATAAPAPGDRIYVDMMRDCLRQKRQLARVPACRAVKDQFRNNLDICSLEPYTDQQFMLGNGLLPEPPPLPTELVQECRSQRFLLWTRNWLDYNAGHSHTTFSLSCAFWEAQRLDRTLVLDSFAGINKLHFGGAIHGDVPYKAWFNPACLSKLDRGGMFYHEFARGCGAPGVLTEESGDAVVMPSGATHAEMLAHANAPLLVRQWQYDQGDYAAAALRSAPDAFTSRFGFQVCHRPERARADYPSVFKEQGVDYALPPGIWSRIYSEWVYRTAKVIAGDLWRTTRARGDAAAAAVVDSAQHGAAPAAAVTGMVVCLHVRRGDKITNPNVSKKYPDLDFDTSPAGIYRTISLYVPDGSTLFIATNERDPVAFFRPLEAHYRVTSLAHYPTILAPGAFLGSTLALVDYTILGGQCPLLIPTFTGETARGFDYDLALSLLHK
eukprot:TRINITY_DN873_c0_g1_i1.p2 TRINITY_DN873_c0_g1~~TRINITY_DN873_c0_g1_i1.p2  ORF type:complete len:538 (+),score=172.23 TRINITY_DN873_c0_g1_i1:97-1710(+)